MGKGNKCIKFIQPLHRYCAYIYDEWLVDAFFVWHDSCNIAIGKERKMKLKRIAIWILSGLIASHGASCYTHIKFAKKGYSAVSWNSTHRKNRYWKDNCPECWKWDYYYSYPNWLDKNWYWNYCRSNKPSNSPDKKLEKTGIFDTTGVCCVAPNTCCFILSWLNENSDETDETATYDNSSEFPYIGSCILNMFSSSDEKPDTTKKKHKVPIRRREE